MADSSISPIACGTRCICAPGHSKSTAALHQSALNKDNSKKNKNISITMHQPSSNSTSTIAARSLQTDYIFHCRLQQTTTRQHPPTLPQPPPPSSKKTHLFSHTIRYSTNENSKKNLIKFIYNIPA